MVLSRDSTMKLISASDNSAHVSLSIFFLTDVMAFIQPKTRVWNENWTNLFSREQINDGGAGQMDYTLELNPSWYSVASG